MPDENSQIYIPEHLKIRGRVKRLLSDFSDHDLLYRGFNLQNYDETENKIKKEHFLSPDYSCNWSNFSTSRDIIYRENGNENDGCYSITVSASKYNNQAVPVHDPIFNNGIENYAHVDVRQLKSSDPLDFEPPAKRSTSNSKSAKLARAEYREYLINNLKIEFSPYIEKDFLTESFDEKYVFVMLSADPNQFSEEIRAVYQNSGLYRKENPTEPLLTVENFFNRIFFSKKNFSLIAISQKVDDINNQVIIYWKDGKFLRSYKAKDLVKNKNLIRLINSYDWYQNVEFFPEKNELMIIKHDGHKLFLSLNSGRKKIFKNCFYFLRKSLKTK